ncbi:MAG TPA: SipW-dependent-type signal peptide-containing protein [Candidatus Onthoplasma faecipullorum]|nr:SipW-dependent-type signal peptide-containing protein [Candidatus Onthoplasma faecipullorum]
MRVYEQSSIQPNWFTIMAVAMVAMLAFGGTFAYFTAEATDVTGQATVGTVEISTGATTTITAASTYAVPGATIYNNQSVSLTNTSTVDIYVFATLSAQIDGQDLYVQTGEDPSYSYESAITAKLGASISNWTAVSGHDGVYGYKVTASTQPSAFIFTVTLSENIKEHHLQNGASDFTVTNNICTDKAGTEYGEALEGKPITVTLTFRAIQAEGFADAAEAYAAL